MAIQLSERIKTVVERLSNGLTKHPDNVVKQDANDFTSNINKFLLLVLEEGIFIGEDLQLKRIEGIPPTNEERKRRIHDRLGSLIDSHDYKAIHELSSNYRMALIQNKIILDEIRQQDKYHLWEQIRLTIFRILTAMGIAAALVFMGLLANMLGVQIGLPLFRMI